MKKDHVDNQTPYDKWLKSLITIIKRHDRGFQKELAIKSGIIPQYMSDILRGKSRASQDLQYKISKALGYTYEDMLLGKIDPPFPDYDKVMQLPIRDRGFAILRIAAEQVGLTGILSAFGDDMWGNEHPWIIQLKNEEINEVELYHMALKDFEDKLKRIKEAYKERGWPVKE